MNPLSPPSTPGGSTLVPRDHLVKLMWTIKAVWTLLLLLRLPLKLLQPPRDFHCCLLCTKLVFFVFFLPQCDGFGAKAPVPPSLRPPGFALIFNFSWALEDTSSAAALRVSQRHMLPPDVSDHERRSTRLRSSFSPVTHRTEACETSERTQADIK